MKKILLVTLIILALFLVSCDKTPGEEPIVDSHSMDENFIKDKKATLDTLDVLSNTIVYQNGGENELDADYFEYYFGDASLAEDVLEYLYYTSADVSVCEVGLFRVNADALEKMYDAASYRSNTLATTFEPYSPTDAEIAESMEMGIVEYVVWFVATSDNTPVVNVIIPE